VLRRTNQRQVLSTVVAVTTLSKLFKIHCRRAVRDEAVLLALRHFGSHLPRPPIVVWDCLSADRDERMQQFVTDDAGVYLEWLPPCAISARRCGVRRAKKSGEGT
jgi:hypothetical protein